jgi:excisionase family DNA binding protein
MAMASITSTKTDRNSVENRMDDALLTVQDAARFLNVTVSWIYEHVRDGAEDRLPVVKLGKYLRFDQRDLRDYIDAKRDASRMRRRRR